MYYTVCPFHIQLFITRDSTLATWAVSMNTITFRYFQLTSYITLIIQVMEKYILEIKWEQSQTEKQLQYICTIDYFQNKHILDFKFI